MGQHTKQDGYGGLSVAERHAAMLARLRAVLPGKIGPAILNQAECFTAKEYAARLSVELQSVYLENKDLRAELDRLRRENAYLRTNYVPRASAEVMRPPFAVTSGDVTVSTGGGDGSDRRTRGRAEASAV